MRGAGQGKEGPAMAGLTAASLVGGGLRKYAWGTKLTWPSLPCA